MTNIVSKRSSEIAATRSSAPPKRTNRTDSRTRTQLKTRSPAMKSKQTKLRRRRRRRRTTTITTIMQQPPPPRDRNNCSKTKEAARKHKSHHAARNTCKEECSEGTPFDFLVAMGFESGLASVIVNPQKCTNAIFTPSWKDHCFSTNSMMSVWIFECYFTRNSPARWVLDATLPPEWAL